ncbi:hypothetical protein ACFVS2_33855 [Brevibacillus sp. NPDC058079]
MIQEIERFRGETARFREALEYIADVSLDKRCEKAAKDVLAGGKII